MEGEGQRRPRLHELEDSRLRLLAPRSPYTSPIMLYSRCVSPLPYYPAPIHLPQPSSGVIPLLKRALRRSIDRGKTQRAVVCDHRAIHVSNEMFDRTWGCGCATLNLKLCTDLIPLPQLSQLPLGMRYSDGAGEAASIRGLATETTRAPKCAQSAAMD